MARQRDRERALRAGGAEVAIIYRRVSTSRQAESGLGLEAQEAAATAAATAAGYRVRVVTDSGISGAEMRNRPGLQSALADLDEGRAAALYVARLDRLTRSLADAADIAGRAERQGWRLWLGDVGIDTSTDTGSLLLGMMASVAQWERRRIGSRARAQHAAAEARGRRWGIDAGPRSRLAPEVRARITSERAAGSTWRTIADGLNEDGISTARGGAWTPAAVASVAGQRSSRDLAPVSLPTSEVAA